MMVAVDTQSAALLEYLADAEVLTPVDLGVADAVCRLAAVDRDATRLAVALAARAPRHGHVCVELDQVAGRLAPQLDDVDRPPPAEDLWPDVEGWREVVAASPVVRAPGEDVLAPLVLDGRRLYLDRYWRYERDLEDRLRAMAETRRDDTDPSEVRRWLDRLFGEDDGGQVDRQRLAAAVTSARALTVLSGGPGTGKTTTIVRIMALLLATVPREDGAGPVRIALAAPTGKAAARMDEAVRDAIPGLRVPDELRAELEGISARTLHRLLGWRRDNATRFRHDAAEPLPYDVVIVDEASMVSLSLMAKLVDAVPRDGRLVLVGDRSQLVSVEAGAVLGDLCGGALVQPGRTLRLSEGTAADLGARYGRDISADADIVAEPGIWDGIIHLEHFFRFGPDSGIGNIARAIQRVDGDAEGVIALLRDATITDVDLVDASGTALPSVVRSAIVEGYRVFVEAALAGEDAERTLELLDLLRVLSPMRRGPRGVELLNRAIEGWLDDAVDGFSPRGPWYLGRPVMVTANDYGIDLFNGDVGVVVRHPDDPDELAVAFARAGGGVRYVGPSRLPPHETVFAMTVHKSQGSQFDRVILVLPTADSPILTRELLYTGVTRAKEHVSVVGREDLLRAAVARPVQRASGLGERLW